VPGSRPARARTLSHCWRWTPTPPSLLAPGASPRRIRSTPASPRPRALAQGGDRRHPTEGRATARQSRSHRPATERRDALRLRATTRSPHPHTRVGPRRLTMRAPRRSPFVLEGASSFSCDHPPPLRRGTQRGVPAPWHRCERCDRDGASDGGRHVRPNRGRGVTVSGDGGSAALRARRGARRRHGVRRVRSRSSARRPARTRRRSSVLGPSPAARHPMSARASAPRRHSPRRPSDGVPAVAVQVAIRPPSSTSPHGVFASDDDRNANRRNSLPVGRRRLSAGPSRLPLDATL